MNDMIKVEMNNKTMPLDIEFAADVSTQMFPWQVLLKQSWSDVHKYPTAQRRQFGPPQSRSVSNPFTSPSIQVVLTVMMEGLKMVTLPRR